MPSVFVPLLTWGLKNLFYGLCASACFLPRLRFGAPDPNYYIDNVERSHLEKEAVLFEQTDTGQTACGRRLKHWNPSTFGQVFRKQDCTQLRRAHKHLGVRTQIRALQ